MPSKEIKKEAIHSILEQSPLDARHYPGLQKISELAKRAVLWGADYNVIKNLDFQKLSASNEITSYFYVRPGRRRVTAWVIVHDYDRSRGADNGKPEHRKWVNKNRVMRAH
jgi:hypothetical protein